MAIRRRLCEHDLVYATVKITMSSIDTIIHISLLQKFITVCKSDVHILKQLPSKFFCDNYGKQLKNKMTLVFLYIVEPYV